MKNHYLGMPDISELDSIITGSDYLDRVKKYESWFVDTAYHIMKRTNDGLNMISFKIC
jgi:hypothetical protein